MNNFLLPLCEDVLKWLPGKTLAGFNAYDF